MAIMQSVILVRFRFTFCQLSNPSKAVYVVIKNGVIQKDTRSYNAGLSNGK
jgi:hypothetical protein